MEILRIEGLCKRFGDKEVLRGLDMTVPANSIFGFIGQNGAGKTTTMKAILGLLKPEAGSISVLGETVTYGQTATNRHVGYLPDVPAFYDFMTSMEYLNLCGSIVGLSPSECRSRGGSLLELVGLGGEKHRIGGFSRGLKQRLGIAQALLNRPRLLICDEPTSALDPVGRREILNVLLAAREQTTVLFSTHILSDMERICTNVALLHRGKIRRQGTLSEMKNQYGGDSWLLELADPAHTSLLSEAFSDCSVEAEGRVILKGREERSFEVMRFLSEREIPVLRLERLEPSLETVFMEVLEG